MLCLVQLLTERLLKRLMLGDEHLLLLGRKTRMGLSIGVAGNNVPWHGSVGLTLGHILRSLRNHARRTSTLLNLLLWCNRLGRHPDRCSRCADTVLRGG